MKKQFPAYYLGLDIGTNSLGWSVTDTKYQLQKFHGREMWGARLFEAASTAVDRRTFRSGRRRLERKRQRVKFLQEIFAEEIAKIDPGFFQRLKESRLHLEDKRCSEGKYCLFGTNGMSDGAFYAKYPTMYHLRQAVINREEPSADVRMVYLALAHIMKARGHFLFPNLDPTNITGSFSELYLMLVQSMQEQFDGMEDWDDKASEAVRESLSTVGLKISERTARLENVFEIALPSKEQVKQRKALAGFLCGGKRKFSDLFGDENLKELTKDSFSFKQDAYEDVEDELSAALGDRMVVVERMKAIYDWSVLLHLLKGNPQGNISSALVESYEEHRKDLKALKDCLKNASTEVYAEIFERVSEKGTNYVNYVGTTFTGKGKLKKEAVDRCTQEAFCEYVRKTLTKENLWERLPDDLRVRIEQGEAFQKQRSKNNCAIPYQLHMAELKLILQQASKHLPFLQEKDSNGWTDSDKIEKIVAFRIPYYIGPLAGTEKSRKERHWWMERVKGMEGTQIRPWNFDVVVDHEKSAEHFIRNMTNKCSYLLGEDVLPRASLCYSEFVARNELNNLTVQGNPLAIEQIEGIYQNLVLRKKGKVTKKKIAEYLRTEGMNVKADAIGGVDDPLQADMTSYQDFVKLFGEDYVKQNTEQIENFILWITLFGDERKMIVRKIRNAYPEISEELAKKIAKVRRYKDWGRLSRTLLDSSEIACVDEATGEIITILTAMRQEPKNLMQLLGSASCYDFQKKIEAFNRGQDKEEDVTYQTVEEMGGSPAIRRALWQTILIVKEVRKIMGRDPERIFIEVAREDGEKKRTVSRKMQLLDLYKSCKKEEADLYALLEGETDAELRSNKLFLYFTQMGKSMYSGEPIELSELYNENVYDRDHIFPRSVTKDDSLDNLVMVNRRDNLEKGNAYPISPKIQEKMMPFWSLLRAKGFISQKKYERLTRKTPLSTEELAGFIQRQLVETRQSSKMAATLLQRMFPDTTIVYSKAGNVSDFRQEFGFVKCRDLNDHHHAKDAYLNIVVGNAYHTKFTANPYTFLQRGEERYSLKTKEMYSRDIQRGEVTAWKVGDNGTMTTVKKTMAGQRVLCTKFSYKRKGQLFDLTLMRKGHGQIPIKEGMSIELYGGYNKAATAYFLLVESTGKKSVRIRSIEPISILVAQRAKKDVSYLENFLRETCELKEPRVIGSPILINTLLEIDGFSFYLTGKSNKSLLGSTAVQVTLPEIEVEYIKKLYKFISRCKIEKSSCIRKTDNITKEQNMNLYECLLLKLLLPCYQNRPASPVKQLLEQKDQFVEMNPEEQVILLTGLLDWMTGKNPVVDLRVMGGSQHGGKFTINKDITNRTSVFLGNYSVTGLFGKRVDLLKL